MDQMDHNLLFRWFVGLGIDDTVWVPTVFTKNRDRLADHRDVTPDPGRHPGASQGGAAAFEGIGPLPSPLQAFCRAARILLPLRISREAVRHAR